MRMTAGMVMVFLAVASSRAWADPSAPPPPASAPAPGYAPPPSYGSAPPAYAPPPSYGSAPPAYAPPPGYAPPPTYAQPPGYGSSWSGGPAYSYAPDPNAMFLYEAQRKSSGLAVLLSLLVPGVGNIYADHAIGAVITWALVIGGAVVAANSIHHTTSEGYNYAYAYPLTTTNVNSNELTLGIFMILGGFVYSPIDAYFASESYNHALAQRLGLPAGFAFGPAPIRTDRSVAWGPGLSFRF